MHLRTAVMLFCCAAAAVSTVAAAADDGTQPAAVTTVAAAADDGAQPAAQPAGSSTEAAVVKRSDAQCPDGGCAAVQCPRDRDACPLGQLVPDGCGCCPQGVCGAGEAAECNAADRPCANSLECVKTDQDGGASKAAAVVYRCACKEKELACGSDNRTYSNVCQLNEAAAKHGVTLWIQYWGPCQSAPVFRSAPKNFVGSIGNPVVFDCEVKGYPVPSISWRFTDTYGISKWLPGDDTLIAIQTRGGPESLTVTSWVQIMTFKPIHMGNYTCIATNSVDTTMVSAALDIRQMT